MILDVLVKLLICTCVWSQPTLLASKVAMLMGPHWQEACASMAAQNVSNTDCGFRPVKSFKDFV